MVAHIFIVLVVIFSTISAEEEPLVSIKDGQIKGAYNISYDGRKYAAFEGIPYAQPPLGIRRFQDPQPALGWKGILEATRKHKCLQLKLLSTEVIGQEDCLYLNVYVPREKIDSKEKLDVIVHFHGGAFMVGDPHELAGPSKLMDRDVVYVSVHYRLGVLGFLSSGDEIIPGNYGMKDQSFSLKWVQNNIENFGGNANSVTITGGSAGGASTHLHYFSPLSKGLFHRGVAENGLALTPWAIRKDPWRNGKRLAKAVGCDALSVKQILSCLREKTAVQLQNAVAELYLRVEVMLPLVLFGPSIEPPSPTAFLSETPYSQLKKMKPISDVPFMAIMTTDEGTAPSMFFLQNLVNIFKDLLSLIPFPIDIFKEIDSLGFPKNPHTMTELNDNLNSYLPYLYEYETFDEDFQKEVSTKIRKHYLNNEPISVFNYGSFTKLCTERLFHVAAEKTMRLHAPASKSDVYFLMMAYAGNGIPGLGVGHCEDGKFYYDISAGGFVPPPLSEEEVKMKDKLLDMFVGFAKTGKPVVDNFTFEPIPKNGSLRYVVINGVDDIEMTSVDHLADIDFWKSLGLEEI